MFLIIGEKGWSTTNCIRGVSVSMISNKNAAGLGQSVCCNLQTLSVLKKQYTILEWENSSADTQKNGN